MVLYVIKVRFQNRSVRLIEESPWQRSVTSWLLWTPLAAFILRYHRMALLQFSNTVRVVFDFNDKPSTDLVRQGIQSMSHMGGDRCIGNALEYARGMFTAAKGMRSDPNVIHEVLLLTSGPSNCGSSLYAATRRLYQMANVYVLGVGALRPSDVLQLNQIGNMPTNRHIFGIDGFNTLSGLVEELEAQSAAVPCVPFDI
ncbi:collagen alpha-3(VI) chain-like [Dreissena polymorpha]|uniref:collagen alpha-3(VI) chain-like n=1 Tax=Dreissena polymorpha TaxID=45954 RepID=UPI00226426CE|nr:collagen alpha-3(VI) chain-like [Dreissena polymorpha]